MVKKSGPLLYNSVEALDSDLHKDLQFIGDVDYKYTNSVNSVPAVIGEVPLASNTYPLVFVELDDGSYILSFVLGFKENVNSYLNAEGLWLAEYVPSYIRKYPFISLPVEGEEDKKVLCVDIKAPHFKAKKGDKLFGKDSKPSKSLEVALRMNEEFDLSMEQTKQFCEDMANANLIEVREENSEFGNIQFHTIKTDAIGTLPAKKITEWQKKGYLNIIVHLIQSSRSWRELEGRARFNSTKKSEDKNKNENKDKGAISLEKKKGIKNV